MADTSTDLMTFATSLPLKVISRRAVDWSFFHKAWDDMSTLYSGGLFVENEIDRFLIRRPKEFPDMYAARKERFTYQNHAGTALDWYLAAMFEKGYRVEPKNDNPPELPPPAPPAVVPKNADGTPGIAIPNPPQPAIPPPPVLSDEDQKFYDGFAENADRAGTPAQEIFRQYYRSMLLHGRGMLLVDLPPQGDFPNRKLQKEAGQFDPFVVCYDARQAINYSRDPQGKLKWIIFECHEIINEAFQPAKKMDRWYYFDQHQFAVYQREVPQDENSPPDDATVDLVNDGEHGLSAQGICPVIFNEISEGLWLMNRAFNVVKDHLNAENVHRWALEMACLAMPVIKSDKSFDLTLAEGGFIQIPSDASYEWAEPEGKSFAHLADRSQSLVEAIFRAFYLIAQARTNAATPAAASGVSKQQDMTAPRKILNVYGDLVRTVIQTTYNYVALMRGDGSEWDARGLEFPEAPPNDEINLVSEALVINVPSPTFEKELMKKTVKAVMVDASEDSLNTIFAEIDAAPDRATAQAQQMKLEAAALVPPFDPAGSKTYAR